MNEGRLFIPVEQIHVPGDYIRPLDEAAAVALAKQMDREGQKTPIAVYQSTARNGGKTPYTLIYGARRLRAAAHLGWDAIEAVLRTKIEAPMLVIADNLAMPSLDALEQAEHLTAYRKWWEAIHGPIERGGDRKSNGHRVRLIGGFNSSENSSFYSEIAEKFGIGERTARRLHSIGRLQQPIRDALRGTPYAKDHKYLKKLTKFAPAEQVGIAAAFKVHPDLDAVLRMSDPATGRKSVGRQDRKSWNRERFHSAWGLMSEVEKREALEEIGAVMKPLPEGFAALPAKATSPVRRPGLDSPLWDFCQLPEERRLQPIDPGEALDITLLQILRESDTPLAWVPAGAERHPRPRGDDAPRYKWSRKRKTKPTGLPKAAKRMLDSFPPRLWWTLKVASVDDNEKIIRLCNHMDAERQELALREIWPGRDLLHMEAALIHLTWQQRKARREHRKEVYGERQSMLASKLVRSGPFKGLHPVLAERLGDANKSDRDLIEVLHLLDCDQQIEAIERLNIGKSLDEIFDWASELVRDAA